MTTEQTPTTPDAPKLARTYTITLTASGNRLTLLARRLADGSGETFHDH
jgi:hypothetical protein